VPELPEVETYARDLREVLPGRSFTGASCDWPNQLPRNEPSELDARVRGQRVESVGRRGKYLTFGLTDDWLLVHLKMSGRLRIADAADPPDPHAHVVFRLDGGDELRFHNPRKFGRVYLLADPDEMLGELGPEPLGDAFTARWLREALRSRRGRLKPLLTDQRFLAGLGNIYVDESLWRAQLHPLQTADSLTDADCRRLHRAIRHVLARAIEARGTSFTPTGYRDLTGNPGEMQGTLAVFGRTDQQCPACGSPIVKMVVAGRGTHVCPICQPRPSDA